MAKRLKKLLADLKTAKRSRIYSTLFVLRGLIDTKYCLDVHNGSEQRQNSLSKGGVHIVDTGLQRQTSVESVLSDAEVALLLETETETKVPLEASNSTTCKTCRLNFENVASQRKHFKTDWHRLNVKLKLKGKPPLTETEANDYFVAEKNETESLSGSGTDESDAEDEIEAGSRVREKLAHSSFVRINVEAEEVGNLSEHLVIRALGASVLNSSATAYDYSILDSSKPWIVILYAAGHFAAVVFRDEKVVTSKTVHRYVTRQKQGGSQSSKDSSGKKAKSAGATLRRYNEQMLEKEVKMLIVSWASHFERCSRVFISIPKRNRSLLFQSPKILSAADERIRRIPFATRRPTVNEASRTLKKLSLVSIDEYVPEMKTYEEEESSQTQTVTTEMKVSDTPLMDTTVAEVSEPVFQLDERMAALVEICDSGDLDRATEFLQEHGPEVLYLSDENGETALHLAAERNNTVLIDLFLESGSSPEISDYRGRVAYQLCKNKESRDWYFMGKNPDMWNYLKASIPSALTEETERARKEKAKAKKKRQAQRRKMNKEKARVEAEAAEQAAKAKAEAEEASAPRCSGCDGKLTGKSSLWFHKFDYVYCSSQCVQTHRRFLSAEAAQKRLTAKKN